MPNFETLIPVIVVIISAIIGPLLTLYAGKKYTDRTIRHNNKHIIDQIEDTAMGDHTIALDTLNTTLKDYLKVRVKSGPIELDLKLIAVAMTFSWDFIVDKLPLILAQDEFSSVSVNLSVCFVDWEHLSELKISTEGRNWAKTSKMVEESIPGYKKMMSSKFGDRFSCDFRTYKNVPHWHGWLVKERGIDDDRQSNGNNAVTDYLFLGRTRWEHAAAKSNKRRKSPKLTVGQNEYRLFTDDTKQGNIRISLFEQWHTYYFEHAFKKKI